MKLFLIKLVFLVLISQICGDKVKVAGRNVGSRIVGGAVARAGQFKFMAAVHVQTSTSTFFCGGTLLSNQWILTAGLCVYDGVLFTVQLGANTLNDEDENRVTVATSHYHLHPDFDLTTLDNDIGIIELRMAVMLNGYIQPVSTSSVHHPGYTESIALGFGLTSDSDAEISNELRYVDVTTVPNEECQVYYGSQITDNMVCVAGNYNEGTCTGDNGSPLIITNGKYSAVVGVASFISGHGCETIHPSGYTRVHPYREWLYNITSWL